MVEGAHEHGESGGRLRLPPSPLLRLLSPPLLPPLPLRSRRTMLALALHEQCQSSLELLGTPVLCNSSSIRVM